MLQKLRFLTTILTLFYSANLLSMEPSVNLSDKALERVEDVRPLPFFFSNLVTQPFFGQNLEVLMNGPFNPYSVFQYILDFGIQLDKEPIRKTDQTISFSALARIKGIFGDKGSGINPFQETKKFEIWMRDLFLLYSPTENKNTFVQMGFFPFKVGNGLVLGNAYDVNIPIAWQFIYEQIDQFRPGFLIQLGDQKKSFSINGYAGFVTSQNNLTAGDDSSTFIGTLIDPALGRKVYTPIAVVQITLGSLENHHFQLSPSIFFQKDKQFIEIEHDAQSFLYTPDIFGLYQRGDIRVGFELAKNCGQQKVFALDRTKLTYTFPSSIPITFENAFNRFRKSYTNNYAGYMAYLDFTLTKKNITWGIAGLYTSGDNDPNDTIETTLLTRFTPGVSYKTYDKKYKGFVGTDQIYETPTINNLYFAAGNFSYNDLALIGSTLTYAAKKSDRTLTGQVTLASYFKPFAMTLDSIYHTGINPNSPLPHYLGTELNYEGSYTVDSHITLSLLGGIFFPGIFYHTLKQQFLNLDTEVLNVFEPSTIHPQIIATSTASKAAFFASFSVTWLFDSADWKKFFKRNHTY